jgi:hypothetical protein
MRASSVDPERGDPMTKAIFDSTVVRFYHTADGVPGEAGAVFVVARCAPGR